MDRILAKLSNTSAIPFGLQVGEAFPTVVAADSPSDVRSRLAGSATRTAPARPSRSHRALGAPFQRRPRRKLHNRRGRRRTGCGPE